MFLSKLTKAINIIIVSLCFIFIIVLLYGSYKHQSPVLDEQELDNGDEVIKQPRSSLDGRPLKNTESKLPIAIVLDNLKESRPISGIKNTSVVYEAPVEADITRFLAIYEQDFLPDKIGPVRSIRPYFTEWAQEYGALFIHAGGSPESLKNIKKGIYPIYNLDEISKDGVYFWRDWQRESPHNIYISKQSIINVIKDKDLNNVIKSDFKAWTFKSEIDEIKPYQLTDIIKIDYREPVIWQFNKDENIYLRYQSGQVFVDESYEQVWAKNIVIQKTRIDILDEIGRRYIQTVGSGQALIFQGGTMIKGTWQRNNNDTHTSFYDENGNEIEFFPGLIWIQIVSDDHRILY